MSLDLSKGELRIGIEIQKLKKKQKKKQLKLVDQVIFNLMTLKNVLSEYLLNLKKNLSKKNKMEMMQLFY